MAGLDHVGVTHADRGPCSRVGCGHPERNHDHHRDSEACGACGARACPGYRPPRPRDQHRPCQRCGVAKRRHADMPLDVALVAPGVCPRWQRPDPPLIRWVEGFLHALGRAVGVMAWALGARA